MWVRLYHFLEKYMIALFLSVGIAFIGIGVPFTVGYFMSVSPRYALTLWTGVAFTVVGALFLVKAYLLQKEEDKKRDGERELDRLERNQFRQEASKREGREIERDKRDKERFEEEKLRFVKGAIQITGVSNEEVKND